VVFNIQQKYLQLQWIIAIIKWKTWADKNTVVQTFWSQDGQSTYCLTVVQTDTQNHNNSKERLWHSATMLQWYYVTLSHRNQLHLTRWWFNMSYLRSVRLSIILRSLQLDFEAFRADLKTIHWLNRCLCWACVVKAYKPYITTNTTSQLIHIQYSASMSFSYFHSLHADCSTSNFISVSVVYSLKNLIRLFTFRVVTIRGSQCPRCNLMLTVATQNSQMLLWTIIEIMITLHIADEAA